MSDGSSELFSGAGYVGLPPFNSDADQDLALARLESGGLVFAWVNFSVVQAYIIDPDGNGGFLFQLTDPLDDIEIASPSQVTIAALASGGFAATWFDTTRGLIARTFDEAGTATSPYIFLTGDADDGYYQQPDVVGLETGGFLVAYSYGNDGSGDGIRAQLFDAGGNQIGSQFDVNSATTGPQVYPQAVALPGGGFVITWVDNVTQSYDAQFYDASGNEVGAQVSLASGTGVFDIAALESGNFVIVWPGADGELHGRIYSGVGVAIGDPFQVNSPTADLEILPEIAPLSSGGFAVTWRSPTDQGPNFFQNGDIRAQIFDASGAPIGGEFEVSTGDLGHSEPHIVSFGSDDLLITYLEYDESNQVSVVGRTFYTAEEGTAGPDVMTGSDGRDFYFGLGGDDQLSGGAGDDELHGGDGNDTLNGGTGLDLLDGGAGNDTLTIGPSGDSFGRGSLAWGGSGSDAIVGGDGGDEIYSGDREDPDLGYSTFDPYFPDFYRPPTLDRGTDVDNISAGAGNDFVSIGYGDSADGGTENPGSIGDRLFLSLAASPTGLTVDFRNTTLSIGGGTITGFEGVTYVEGSQFNDVFTFSASPYPIEGFGGPSGGGTEISGLGGDDQITAGYYTNSVWGGEGSDILDGRASQYLMYLGGGTGNDTLFGSWVFANLDGGDGNDVINGGDGSETIFGGAGNDEIHAGKGDDAIHGGPGADLIDAGEGNDSIYLDSTSDFAPGEQIDGGAGTDSLIAQRAPGAPAIFDFSGMTWTGIENLRAQGGATIALSIGQFAGIAGVSGSFQLTSSGALALTATALNNTLQIFLNDGGNQLNLSGLVIDEFGFTTVVGGAAGDVVIGSLADDELYGQGGDDNLFGGNGNDVVLGGAGNDILGGGSGEDWLIAGSGSDTFRDTAAGLGGDTISDFELGDRIVITDATLDGFTFSVNGNGLSFTGGSVMLSSLGEGTLVATAAAGGGVQIAFEIPPFSDASLVLNAFGYSAGSWTSDDRYPRALADVNGDGHADIIGFGNAGAYVALGNAYGEFLPSVLATANFGFSADAGGWASNNIYSRHLADVNGDNRADIVAFGEAGTYVALGNADGTFGQVVLGTGEFGRSAPAGGWSTADRYPRELADVNGDGRADIVGFGNDGVYVALSNGNGTFGPAQVASVNFGYSTGAGGWTSDDRYPRQLADVNGDGRADIVAFGEGGTYVALGNADGTFGAATIATGEFGRSAPAGGWTSNDLYHRELADVNGDDRADIVGFGLGGVYVALGQANGTFGPSQVVSGNFGAGPEAGGWSSQDAFPRHLADIDNDGLDDLVGFGANGVYVALSIPDYWV